MGKYNTGSYLSWQLQIQENIANELAESNRLKRLEMNKDPYDFTSTELEDKA